MLCSMLLDMMNCVAWRQQSGHTTAIGYAARCGNIDVVKTVRRGGAWDTAQRCLRGSTSPGIFFDTNPTSRGQGREYVDDTASITYGELDDEVRRVAAALPRHGIAPRGARARVPARHDRLPAPVPRCAVCRRRSRLREHAADRRRLCLLARALGAHGRSSCRAPFCRC